MDQQKGVDAPKIIANSNHVASASTNSQSNNVSYTGSTRVSQAGDKLRRVADTSAGGSKFGHESLQAMHAKQHEH